MTEQTRVEGCVVEEPKTAVITLHGTGMSMRLTAIRRADGTATTFVLIREDGKKQSMRGLTEQHPDLAAARERLEVLANDAEKQGWSRTVRRGFVAKPDSFSAIPAAPKAAKGGRK